MKKQNRPEWAKNIAEASRLTGITRTTLTGYRRDGCPAFKSNNRVNLVELDAWTEVHGKKTKDDSAAMKAERLRILRATAERLERENQTRRGEMVERTFVVAMVRRGLCGIFAELDRMTNELPPMLAGLDANSIADRLQSEKTKIGRALEAEFLSWKTTPPPAETTK